MTSHSSEWDVEVTEEFEAWWETLDADEQESLAACVELLERRGRTSGTRTVPTSGIPATATCASCESSIGAGRTGCSMRSIRGVSRCC